MVLICPHTCKDCYAMRTCAVHAIEEKNNSIYIDKAQCIGCGCCKTACMHFGGKALQNKTTKWLMGD